MTIIYLKITRQQAYLLYVFIFGFKDLRYKLFHQESKNDISVLNIFYIIDEVLRFKDLLTCS